MLAAFANAPTIEAQQKCSGSDLYEAVRAQRSAAPHQMRVGVDPQRDRCQKAGTQLLLRYFHATTLLDRGSLPRAMTWVCHPALKRRGELFLFPLLGQGGVARSAGVVG